MAEAKLLLWGDTQVGKTTLLAAGLLDYPNRLPAFEMAGADRDRLKKYRARLDNNSFQEPTEIEPPLVLKLQGGNSLVVQDIKGELTREAGKGNAGRPSQMEGVLFVVEWAGTNSATHLSVVRTEVPHCLRRKVGLAITKSERCLGADDPHWLAPSGWWREHSFWRDHEALLELFGDRVWPTSAYGFDLDERPACVLDEFGELMPCGVRPKNVEVPFRWFFQELCLWKG